MIERQRPVVSLRTLSYLAGFCILLYVIGLTVYIGAGVAPRAARFRSETAPMLDLFDKLAARATAADQAMEQVRRGVNNQDTSALDSVRTYLDAANRDFSPLTADAPLVLRELLARTEVLQSSFEARMAEILADQAVGRSGAASARLGPLDSVHAEMGLVLVKAERIGLSELAAREDELNRTLRETIGTMVGWVAAGVVLLLILIIVANRRVQRPLRELEAGLDAVAAGELNTSVRVRQHDELGRLAANFNEMTGVLRARAAEQGRFAAAGELIAGVAHEVNNPLMAIAAMADSRLEEPDLDPELRAELEQIHRQARRAGKLLSGLLRFVRAREPVTATVQVNAVVASAVDLVSYRFGVEEIAFEMTLAGDLPPARGSAVRLEQVFVNLLSNALDSLTGVPPPRRLSVETWLDAGTVHVAVTDRGPGIQPEMRPRLFRPFASTKGAGGTGLGLYISREIVREVGGDLVHEPVTEGARFVVTLPVSTDESWPERDRLAAGGEAAPSAPRHTAITGLRVLLVDDEEAVRSPIARFLVRRGVTVLEASDGREALARLGDGRVDAIVADLRMPRMDGAAFCAELARTRPDLLARVILLSGDLSQLEGVLPVPGDRVLAKPVELREIETTIARIARV